MVWLWIFVSSPPYPSPPLFLTMIHWDSDFGFESDYIYKKSKQVKIYVVILKDLTYYIIFHKLKQKLTNHLEQKFYSDVLVRIIRSHKAIRILSFYKKIKLKFLKDKESTWCHTFGEWNIENYKLILQTSHFSTPRT